MVSLPCCTAERMVFLHLREACISKTTRLILNQQQLSSWLLKQLSGLLSFFSLLSSFHTCFHTGTLLCYIVKIIFDDQFPVYKEIIKNLKTNQTKTSVFPLAHRRKVKLLSMIFTQQIFVEHPLCAGYWCRYLRYFNEQKRQNSYKSWSSLSLHSSKGRQIINYQQPIDYMQWEKVISPIKRAEQGKGDRNLEVERRLKLNMYVHVCNYIYSICNYMHSRYNYIHTYI